MDNNTNLALIAQMIDSAEKNIQTAKQLLREMMGGKIEFSQDFARKAQTLSVSEGGKIIEGVFDGQNMVGPDGKQYPVPANYASKSKLVEGDVLKLTIAEDGSFIYKQIGPVERRKVLGTLAYDDKGEYKVITDNRTYRVLLASLTYFKAEAGDQVTIVVPKDQDSAWGAVENVIKQGSATEPTEISSEARQEASDETELEEI
jgi:bifunctional DNA-binding transcriptional regulator/antitoxin component of YhaV-PrlF toxin-antitoxin module